MFGCCRRGINLLFVAVNQISTDRFKLIASVSWSPKKRVLQAPISFYSPSDILINDTRVHARMHTHTHTHTQNPCSFFSLSDFLKCYWHIGKGPWINACTVCDDTISLQYIITDVTCLQNILDIFSLFWLGMSFLLIMILGRGKATPKTWTLLAFLCVCILVWHTTHTMYKTLHEMNKNWLAWFPRSAAEVQR